MDAAIYSLSALVALWILRPVLAQAQRAGLPADSAREARARRPTAGMVDLEEEAGPYARLAARLTDIEHQFKLLSNEWQDKESRVDALLKRIHRLRKIEGDQVEEQPVPAVPVTREAVLAKWRAQQQGG